MADDAAGADVKPDVGAVQQINIIVKDQQETEVHFKVCVGGGVSTPPGAVRICLAGVTRTGASSVHNNVTDRACWELTNMLTCTGQGHNQVQEDNGGTGVADAVPPAHHPASKLYRQRAGLRLRVITTLAEGPSAPKHACRARR